MFKTGNSSGSSGDGGGGRKSRGLFAGGFRLPHRASAGSKRRNQHVNYDYSLWKRVWSKITGKAPRIPGTVRGRKRWANTFIPQKMPMARHGGRKKSLSSVKMLIGGGVPSHTGKRRRLGREFKGLVIPTAEHSGKKRRWGSGFTGATAVYDSHGGRKRKRNPSRAVDVFTSSSYRGGKGKEIAGVRPVVFFDTAYGGGKRKQNPMGVFSSEPSHRGSRRGRNPVGMGSAWSGSGHRGRSRRLSSRGWEPVVATPHRGGRRKENRSLVVASGQAYSGSRKLFSFRASQAVPKALGSSHRGTRKLFSFGTSQTVPKALGSSHRGTRKLFSFGTSQAVPKALGSNHRGSRWSHHRSRVYGVSQAFYRGGGHRRHRNDFVYGIPRIHHRGSRQRSHGDSGLVAISGQLYRGGGHQRHRNAFEFGIPHIHHRGSKQSRHTSGGFGFAFGESYSGNRRKGSRSFLPPEVSAPYGGNRKNHHSGFVAYHRPAVYRSGGFFDMVFGTQNRHESFVPSKYLRRYKVTGKRKRVMREVSVYHSSLARSKYKPRKRDVVSSMRAGGNATARRRGEMAYLRKISRGRRRKSNDMGMYQGHVSLNQFLRGVILVLSILVAITLFILASTFDSWWDFGVETDFFEGEISTVSTSYLKKTENLSKKL